MVYFFKKGYMMKDFLEIMNFRHACKLFDSNKKISNRDIKEILEAGRLSPSSFGMEGWKFLVITNQELKDKIQPLCWNQKQIGTCSHLIVMLTAIDSLKPSSGIPQKRLARKGIDEEMLKAYIEKYSNFLGDKLNSDRELYHWGSKQVYIAMTSMMLASASLGIDSCPIEGFEKEPIEELLGIDTDKFQLSVILPLGYRVNPQPKRIRLDFDEVVEFIE